MPVKPEPYARSWVDDSGLVHWAARMLDPIMSLSTGTHDIVAWVTAARWNVACGHASNGRLADGRAITCLWCAALSHRRTA